MSTVWKWLGIAGAVALAVLTALLTGWRKGTASQADHDAAATAQDALGAARTRQEVQSHVDFLPKPATDVPARLDDDLAGTAGGKLRDDGWTRD